MVALVDTSRQCLYLLIVQESLQNENVLNLMFKRCYVSKLPDQVEKHRERSEDIKVLMSYSHGADIV